MLKRKLQVSSPTFTLKNPVGDKWAQQPHPPEDGSGRARPTDAADDPGAQPAVCGKRRTATGERLLLVFLCACLTCNILRFPS